MKDTATVAYTKDKGKYQFLKASNIDDQNLHMSQFTFDFVCNTGKKQRRFIFSTRLFIIENFWRSENDFSSCLKADIIMGVGI